MKLLILTQKVDKHDDVLGFMHGWIREFAAQSEKVTVVCLQKGKYDLPANVEVLSLGKEEKASKIRYLLNFYRFIWKKRNDYDAVLVHMNHEYVILGGLLWKMLGKKIALWYAHGHVPSTLRLAEVFSDVVLTSTQSGFRLPSSKVRVIGQGIDTEAFSLRQNFDSHTPFTIVTIGRISPVKDYETLLRALLLLKKKNFVFRTHIIGGAGMEEQQKYFDTLKNLVRENNVGDMVYFEGPVANTKILSYLERADLFVNTSHTGSLDKAMVEAMSTGLTVVTCNEAMKEVLGRFQSSLMYEKKDDVALAQKIEWFASLTPEERKQMGTELRHLVEENHSLKKFVKKIISFY